LGALEAPAWAADDELEADMPNAVPDASKTRSAATDIESCIVKNNSRADE
jgi:hypothetical protein